jgi:hypothetical protein
MIRYKKSRAFSALFIYGLLCRIQETAIFSAVSWCGVWQITFTDDPLQKEQSFSCSLYLRTLVPHRVRLKLFVVDLNRETRKARRWDWGND